METAPDAEKARKPARKKAKATEAAPAAPPDEATRFHDAVNEWLDLTYEFERLTKENWKEARGRKEPEIGLSRQDRLNMIAEGRAADLMKMMAKSPKEDVRLGKMKERLRELDAEIAGFREREDLRPAVREMFRPANAWRAVGKELDALSAVDDRDVKTEFDLLKSARGRIGESDRAMLSEIADERAILEARRSKIENGAETGLAARLHELRGYQEGLATERFAETPSRKAYLDKIRRLWEEGKNVLLTGPTGTGKTELLVHEGKKLHGASPEIVRCSERTGPAEIFGKTLLKATPEGGTETFYQPGRYVSAIDKGTPVVFDEFNLLETKTRLQLKELYNRKPGDTVVIQEDTGLPHVIQDGFGFAATANVKGEKHKERFDLDPAETRVFEQVKVDYLPKHELYDLSLAKLMDKRGGVRLSKEDAAETLKNLAEAAEMIQSAYLGTQTAFYEDAVKKKAASLEKAVLDPGRALSMLEGWEAASAKGASFKEFLNDRLLGFMNAEDLPEKDRRLLLKILVSKGFLAGRKPEEINVPGLKTADLLALGWKEGANTDDAPLPDHINRALKIIGTSSVPGLEQTMKDFVIKNAGSDDLNFLFKKTDAEALTDWLKKQLEESAKKKAPSSYLRPEDVAKLDPFDIRKRKLAAIGEEFLGGETVEAGESREPQAEFKELIESERTKLSEFFGKPIDVPPLPSEITPERAAEWKKLGFELHYLPAEDMTEDAPFPGWKKKPKAFFHKGISDGRIEKGAAKLPGTWLLIDGRSKPDYADGRQMYKDDPLAPALEELRKKGVIGKSDDKPSIPIDSRFKLSWAELHAPEMRQKIAEILKTDPDRISLPRAIEWNVIGNIHHPEWGETNTWEWFEESYESSDRLDGGSSGSGGLSLVVSDDAGNRFGGIGFRPSVRFSSK